MSYAVHTSRFFEPIHERTRARLEAMLRPGCIARLPANCDDVWKLAMVGV